jgi:predicted  nucleic acid-binding Zn-ribbon protein
MLFLPVAPHFLAAVLAWQLMPDVSGNNLPVWAVVLFIGLAWLSREGIGAWKQFRKTRMEEEDAESKRKKEDSHAIAQREMAGWTALVEQLKERITALEQALKEQQKTFDQKQRQSDEKITALTYDHTNCIKAQASAEAQITTLQEEVKGLREWRHQIANQANVVALKAIEDQMSQDARPPLA